MSRAAYRCVSPGRGPRSTGGSIMRPPGWTSPKMERSSSRSFQPWTASPMSWPPRPPNWHQADTSYIGMRSRFPTGISRTGSSPSRSRGDVGRSDDLRPAHGRHIAPMPMRSPWCAGFVARCHPDAEAPLLAGSRSRGRGAPGSDYDVILLFGELPNEAWRETARLRSRSSRPSRTIAARSAIVPGAIAGRHGGRLCCTRPRRPNRGVGTPCRGRR